MSGVLDKILTIVVPVAVFYLFGSIFFKAFREPILKLFHWIRGLFSRGESSVGSSFETYEISYR